MTNLSPREKATRDALKLMHRQFCQNPTNEHQAQALFEAREALRAYDPPKPKIPVLPPWEEFAVGKVGRTAGEFVGPSNSVQIDKQLNVWIYRSQYEALRSLTSKEQE